MMEDLCAPDEVGLSDAALARFMPMYVRVSASGHIRSAGPTLTRICGRSNLIGARFLEVFEVQRPERAGSMADLLAASGSRLHMTLRAPPRTGLRGIAMPLTRGQERKPDLIPGHMQFQTPGQYDGMLINLSFGIAVADAVRDHALTDADFAPTDLTIEMLYLAEVKAAVTNELDGLNRRLRAAQEAAEQMALTDPLTGLANRRALELSLDRAAMMAAAGGPPFALAHIDLDFFKAVNDTYGHAAGDQVLLRVAEVLRSESRRQDVVARVGGDEFVLLLEDLVSESQIGPIATRIIAALERPVVVGGAQCRISGSLGVTFSTSYAKPDRDRMMSDADRALYASKHGGRGRMTLCRPEAATQGDSPAE